MKTVIADKIASVAQDKALKRELRVSADIPCEEGVLIAVEILNNKATYNKLELTSGRMAQVKRGDVIIGALGHRKALFGYSGHLPKTLVPGDETERIACLSHDSRAFPIPPPPAADRPRRRSGGAVPDPGGDHYSSRQLQQRRVGVQGQHRPERAALCFRRMGLGWFLQRHGLGMGNW